MPFNLSTITSISNTVISNITVPEESDDYDGTCIYADDSVDVVALDTDLLLVPLADRLVGAFARLGGVLLVVEQAAGALLLLLPAGPVGLGDGELVVPQGLHHEAAFLLQGGLLVGLLGLLYRYRSTIGFPKKLSTSSQSICKQQPHPSW